MRDIYTRLKDAGFDATYVRKYLLPTWWDDSMAANPAQRQFVEIRLARTLGLSPAAFRDVSASLQPSVSDVAFKRHRGTKAVSFVPTIAVARRAAELAVRATPQLSPALGVLDADEIRANTHGPIGFSALVDAAWNAGVPVLRVCALPRGAGRIDGLTLNLDGRPVVVICSRKESEAWLLWILAHELGHVFHEHVAHGETRLDESIGGPTDDPREGEANTYATRLIFGGYSPNYRTRHRLGGARLAALAENVGHNKGIDPGAVITNYAYTMSREGLACWGAANVALKHLGLADGAAEVLRHAAIRHLNFDALTAEEAGLLEHIADLATN